MGVVAIVDKPEVGEVVVVEVQKTQAVARETQNDGTQPSPGTKHAYKYYGDVNRRV
jgi:hypothetical protein